MTSVTNSFSSGQTIVAADLNTNFTDLVSLVTSVGNDQLAGSITWDKISDNGTVSWSNFNLVPYSGTVSTNLTYASVTEIAMPTSYSVFLRWQPIQKPGVDCFLTGIMVYCKNSTISTATWPSVRVRLNGSTVIGQAITLDTDDQIYMLANSDPITSPLITIADGDYLEVAMGPSTGSASATAAGVWISFGIKYRLVGG